MKKFTIIAVLLLACAGIHAQGLTLSLDITAGGLKEAITPEQRKAVTNLTLTGSMNDADFYLIRDSMPRIDFLDLKYVQVDTIPAKAFYQSGCRECTLPVNLKYIGDEAFLSSDLQTILLTGPFPKLGSQAIEKGFYGSALIVSGDNIHCSQYSDCSIYSTDGRILYFGEFHISCLEDEVEIIESRAFDGSLVWSDYDVAFLSGLKLIKKYAFSNLALIGNSFEFVRFICLAPIPPVLEEHAFDDERLFEATLNVPYESVDLYKQSDSQWSKFREITGWIPLSIENNPEHFITTTRQENGWQINTEKSIQSIRIADSSGVSCSFSMMDDRHIFLNSNKNNRQLYFVNIVFEDGTSESLKLLN